ncbi:hypothetical protein POM88_038935 [Heracleum sosnowskyi]|uniref:Helitron helicase-like domain-containing protein n=1 Tax=Heracleum sosnowskyi TaxID=360622 RepID=A0AAD8HBN1_9APIA|nr:hypothetical protein POM88_038935 [Heracleum sosnowskyi]
MLLGASPDVRLVSLWLEVTVLTLLHLEIYTCTNIFLTCVASPWDNVAPSPVPIRASGSSVKSSNSRYGLRPQIPLPVENSQQSEIGAGLMGFQQFGGINGICFYGDGDDMSSSQLFTSDDMMKGFQKCPTRRKKIRKDKENMGINKSNGSSSPMYPLSKICNTEIPFLFKTPTVSSCKQKLEKFKILNTPTSASVNKSTASSLKPKPKLSFVNKSLNIQTSSSSAVRSIDMECINKNDDDTMDRQPLSNITNQKSQSISRSQKEKGKGKLLNAESTRNLFEEEFQSPLPERSDDYYDQLEHSIIGDSEYNEDGTDDSNDEYCTKEPWGDIGDIDSDVESLPSSSKLPKKTRRSCEIPEEYATLGAPSVKCTQCNALMWKEERVNKNVTKGTPIFSLCCKKGDVKLANALAIPPYLLQLYNDEVGDSTAERDMISMKDYYSYRFQVRENEGMTARLGDIVSRVFKMKLDQMTNDIKKKSYFGKCVGIMYVVEFQKRGLPHVHMLIWLDSDSKWVLNVSITFLRSTFAKWVLDIGDGNVYPRLEDMGCCLEDDIVIPPQFCDLKNDNSVENMIKATYPDFLENCQDPKFLSERAILTPTNHTVGHLNSLIVQKLPVSKPNCFD